MSKKSTNIEPSKTLYNVSDVKRVRTTLYEEQNGLDALTGLPIDSYNSVLDHSHTTQHVRGVIDRNVNVFLGKIENSFIRYIGYWYKEELSTILRKISDYLDQPEHDYIHPGWLNRVRIDFNKLKSFHKDSILSALTGIDTYRNDKERQTVFHKTLLTKQYDYDTIRELIQEVGNYTKQ